MLRALYCFDVDHCIDWSQMLRSSGLPEIPVLDSVASSIPSEFQAVHSSIVLANGAIPLVVGARPFLTAVLFSGVVLIETAVLVHGLKTKIMETLVAVALANILSLLAGVPIITIGSFIVMWLHFDIEAQLYSIVSYVFLTIVLFYVTWRIETLVIASRLQHEISIARRKCFIANLITYLMLLIYLIFEV